jgi:hypothetical protein
MADIAEPVAGSPILDSWGVAVTQKLNRMPIIQVTADEATDSATAVDLDELAFDVTSGRFYMVRLFGAYAVSATNQGLQLGCDRPTGSCFLFMTIAGKTGYNDFTYDSTSSALQGTTATDSTNNRALWIDIWYACTANGTFTVQFARGGTSGSTGVTILAGTGGIVLESGA